MRKNDVDVIIIGGGLTGLSIAYFLKDENINIKIIEARNRLGGRILTTYKNGSAPIEKGATWFGKKHKSLFNLLQELEIKTFKQELGDTAIYEPISTSPHQLVQLPPNNDPSFRIQGGTSVLIHTLANVIKSDQIHTKQVVRSIEEVVDGLLVKTNSDSFKSKIVISTLPPNLFISTIDVYPKLPMFLTAIAQNTHTWMGESIKIALLSDTPFWRSHSSGTVVSNVGPIPEMYDHSNFENSSYALKGFLNSSYYSIGKEERKGLVLGQLHKYYGQQIEKFSAYEELVWRNEQFTFIDYQNHVLPHQNNGHPAYQTKFLSGRLFIGGSETASEFPGYMEGAIQSAKYICDKIVHRKENGVI